MKAKTIIFLLALSYCVSARGQRFHGLYANVEYQTNFQKSVFNGTLDYEIRFTIDSTIKLASIGLGGGWHLPTWTNVNSDGNKTFLVDVKLSWALDQGYVCYFYMSDRYPTWYFASHYRFNFDFERQYICPEIGYNFQLARWFLISPSLNFYWNIRQSENWKSGFYPTIKIIFNHDHDPHTKFTWRRSKNKNEVRSTFILPDSPKKRAYN